MDETVSVLNMAVRMMNLEQLHQFISRLPAASQKVFNLYVIDGFTHPGDCRDVEYKRRYFEMVSKYRQAHLTANDIEF